MNEGTLLTESELEELRRYAKAGAGSPVDFVGLARALDKALGHIDAMRAVPTPDDVARRHGVVVDAIASGEHEPGCVARGGDCRCHLADAMTAAHALRDWAARGKALESERDALQARVAELEGTLKTEEAERIRCRDRWAGAQGRAAAAEGLLRRAVEHDDQQDDAHGWSDVFLSEVVGFLLKGGTADGS